MTHPLCPPGAARRGLDLLLALGHLGTARGGLEGLRGAGAGEGGGGAPRALLSLCRSVALSQLLVTIDYQQAHTIENTHRHSTADTNPYRPDQHRDLSK